MDSRFKFGFFKVVKGTPAPKGHAFDARFYLHDPMDAFATPIQYSLEMLDRFSPRLLSVMEFRSADHYAAAAQDSGRPESARGP